MADAITKETLLNVTLPYGALLEAAHALRQHANRLDDLAGTTGEITYSESVTLPLRLMADEARRDAKLIDDAIRVAQGFQP